MPYTPNKTGANKPQFSQNLSIATCWHINSLDYPASTIPSKTVFFIFTPAQRGGSCSTPRYSHIQFAHAKSELLHMNTNLNHGLDTYPQSGHVAVSYIAWAFFGDYQQKPHTGKLLLTYALVFTYIIALISLAAGYILRTLTEWFSKKNIVTLLASVIIYFHVGLRFFDSGFFNQAIATLAVMITIATLITNTSPRIKKIVTLSCIILVSSSWYMLLATLFVPVVVNVRTLWPKGIHQYFLYILSAIVCLTPIALSLAYQSTENQLLASGYTHQYDTTVDKLVLALGLVCLLILITKSSLSKISKYTPISSLISAGLLASFIGIYQIAQGYPLMYYFYKNLDII